MHILFVVLCVIFDCQRTLGGNTPGEYDVTPGEYAVGDVLEYKHCMRVEVLRTMIRANVTAALSATCWYTAAINNMYDAGDGDQRRHRVCSIHCAAP